MKKLYTNSTITAEQFTDECTPEGVIPAPKEFMDLFADFQPGIVGSGFYMYEIPYPDDDDKLYASYLNAPYPFYPIEKGDYVITQNGGYSTVIPEKVFKREYFQIEISYH